MTDGDPAPSPARRLWLTGEREEPTPHGAAVPIRTVLGAPAAPGRWTRGARAGARWGVWVLALAAIVAGGTGLWHLLYGDRVSGDVFLGRPPAALATTTTSSTTTTTLPAPTPTTTAPPAAGPAPAAPGGGSSGPGPGTNEAGDDRGPSPAAGPGPAPTPSVTVADDHGGDAPAPSLTVDDDHSGRSSNRGPGSGSGSSGSGSSGSGSSGPG